MTNSHLALLMYAKMRIEEFESTTRKSSMFYGVLQDINILLVDTNWTESCQRVDQFLW